MNNYNDNPFQEEGQLINPGPFFDLIEAGASTEDAAEITGISPELLAMCRKIQPNFDLWNRVLSTPSDELWKLEFPQ